MVKWYKGRCPCHPNISALLYQKLTVLSRAALLFFAHFDLHSQCKRVTDNPYTKFSKVRYFKMRIKVYGKAHLEGVAKKSGNPYNFNQVHYLGKARGVEGQAALTLALDSFDYPIERIEVGREYDVEFDNRGYVVAFAPAK